LRDVPWCQAARHLRSIAQGAEFASEKADFSVSDVFTIVSQNMPATNPGSLEHDDYVEIMAYLP
jgi:polar amino acid transport system substrate-binding protein